MFVSTIPMRASVQGSLTFLDFVKKVMADQMKILRHQKYPYNVLMNDLRERDGFTGRLFDISLEYQVMQWQKKENLSFITEPIFSGSGMNDISIHVKDRWDTDTLTIDLDYRTDLFSEDDMSKLLPAGGAVNLTCFQHFLRNILHARQKYNHRLSHAFPHIHNCNAGHNDNP